MNVGSSIVTNVLHSGVGSLVWCGRGCACGVREGGRRKISVLSAQFLFETKIVLKNKVCLKQPKQSSAPACSEEIITPISTKRKKLNKLKINKSSYIHQRTEIKGKPQSPKLERQTSRYRESQLNGTECQKQIPPWGPVLG